MPDYNSARCHSCTISQRVRFCQECALVTCESCLHMSIKTTYSCNRCNFSPQSDICGSCGSEAEIMERTKLYCCPSCKSTRVDDPQLLLDNYQSSYHEIISRVQSVNEQFIDLYRDFDFLVGLVRYCRLGNLYGLPQMEMQLELSSNAMKKINKEGIDELNKLRQEGLYDLRTHNYFKNIKLEHYRSLDALLKGTEIKINQHIERIQFWISEVQEHLEKLHGTAQFLKDQYTMLYNIKPYLPDNVYDVVAIIPPLNMHMKRDTHKINDKCYVIFTENYCIFLPKNAIKYKLPDQFVQLKYSDLKNKYEAKSIIKGTQYIIELKQGEIQITAPPQIITTINQYFGLIDSDEPFMVGSPKKIKEIEENGPDKYEYKRAAAKFASIFREWLFDDRVQNEEYTPELEIPSMTDLKHELKKLDNIYNNYNSQVENHEIPLEQYQIERGKIKDNIHELKSKLASKTGYFGKYDNY